MIGTISISDKHGDLVETRNFSHKSYLETVKKMWRKRYGIKNYSEATVVITFFEKPEKDKYEKPKVVYAKDKPSRPGGKTPNRIMYANKTIW